MAEAKRIDPQSDKDCASYIPASSSLPEITLKAVVLGMALSAILAGANAYLGLKVGLTVSASVPAAVISMAVLRLFREHNILENNIVQTAASAGESLAAGVIFTLPALILLQYWQKFEFLPTMAIALCGGILGVLFTIPLRRALIIEDELRFPEGIATAEVLKAGTEGGKGARDIIMAAVAGAVWQFLQSGLRVASGSVSGAIYGGSAIFGFGSGLGVALLGVGYIVGHNIAILVFAGGLISWAAGIPLYTAFADSAVLADVTDGSTGYAAAHAVWSARIRFMGVGAMATGGVWALIALLKPIRNGVRTSLEVVRAARSGKGKDVLRTEHDAPIDLVIIGTILLTIPLTIVFFAVIDQDALGITTGLYGTTIFLCILFALVAGFLFSSVAGYMAGLVGSSNNPISGVTIAAILTISLILLTLLGSQIEFNAARGTAAAATAILVGGVVCCAAAIAGDNMQDLKAGRIVGATPYKQQIMQLIGVLAAAIVIAPILQLLFAAYGLGDTLPRAGMDPSRALQAPQATLMSSIAGGVFRRDLPWIIIGAGVVIAIIIILVDQWLKARRSTFRTPVLAVAVGIYLPLELTVPIFIGGAVAWLAGRRLVRAPGVGNPTHDNGAMRPSRRGLLFASGLITGEALLGILLAIPFAISQSTDVFVPSWVEDDFASAADLLGIIGFGCFAAWLYRTASRCS